MQQRLQRRSSLVGNVLKLLPVSEISIDQRALRVALANAALFDFGVHMAVCNYQVFPAVLIHIHERDTPPEQMICR